MGPGCHARANWKNTVVLVSAVSDFLLVDARAALERSLKSRPQPDIALVFGSWIAQAAAETSEAATIAAAAVQRSGAQQDFQTVAILGYALHGGLLDTGSRVSLKQGLDRLAGRQPFVDEVPMPFCSDAIGLLGVAVGAREIADTSVSSRIVAWLGGFIKKIYEMDGTEDWQRCLFCAADHVLGQNIGLSLNASAEAADVRVALRAKGILTSAEDHAAEEEEANALKLIARNSSSQFSYGRAAIRLAALEWITRSAPVAVPGRITSQNLLQLLERVPAGLRRWTWEKTPRTANSLATQWHIDHEYHVQNTLWLLLAPIFPDLDDEQYLKKIGQKSPRADLYIPSMKIIVEAKFIRPGEKFQKAIDEIAADASLYRAMGNDCDGIIPFIWDDSSRSQEHDYLRKGLKKLPGVIDAVVISRPSDWNRQLPAERSKRGRRSV
jgi:hypothetical protein